MAGTRTSASLAAACLAALALSAPAGAAVVQPATEKPAFDARGNDPLGAPSTTERAARHSLQQQLGPTGSVTADSAAITVAGAGELLTPPKSADPATVAL